MKIAIRIICATLISIASSGVALCQASTTRPINFQIASQPVGDALLELARQTGLQVVFYADAVQGITAPAVVGRYTADEALSKILRETTLTASFVNAKTVTIVDTRQSTVEGVAAVPNETSSTSSSGEQAIASEQAFLERDVQAPNSQSSVSEVVVTGTQIRGIDNVTAPVTVLNREYIDSSGVSTTSSLLAALPQNFSLTSQSGISIPGVTGNAEQGASINLRGIGEGTTLVLLNGRRIAPGFTGSAVDISALPLSAIKRVEVLTDGASAIYGSDAVGGVVNFILQDDYEGAATNIKAGGADGGIHEYQASQTVGHRWTGGNILISGEFYRRDLLPASSRSFASNSSLIGSLLPRDKNYSVLLSGRQTVAEPFTVFSDVLFTKRSSFNQGGQVAYLESNSTSNPQLNATLGLDWSVSREWQLEASGAYSRNALDLHHDSSFVTTGIEASLLTSRFDIRSAELKADGAVIALPGGTARAALGTDWRRERLTYSSSYISGASGAAGGAERTVRSVFGELYIPVLGPRNSLPVARRLDLSVAARYDQYSDFGSSVNPKVGLTWEPVSALRFRASYGTSYVAPRLLDYNTSSNDAVAFTDIDPASPTGTSRQLEIDGVDSSGLRAQRSRNFSIGAEFAPTQSSAPRVAVNYFNIRYRNEIAYPPSTSVMLGNPSAFGSLLIRQPSVAQVNQAIAIGNQGLGFFPYNPDFSPDANFDPATIDVIIDERRRNLSVVKTHGMDFSSDWSWVSSMGKWSAGLASTYVFALDHQVTSESQQFNTAGTFYNTPHFRGRLSVGWEKAPLQTNIFINQTGSYTDNRTSSLVHVSSYTTVDGRFAVVLPKYSSESFLSGFSLGIAVQNVFNRDPPHAAIVNPAIDLGFDPTNAYPLGRLASIELTKSW
jgi:iron complex outermembrane recepter protein